MELGLYVSMSCLSGSILTPVRSLKPQLLSLWERGTKGEIGGCPLWASGNIFCKRSAGWIVSDFCSQNTDGFVSVTDSCASSMSADSTAGGFGTGEFGVSWIFKLHMCSPSI